MGWICNMIRNGKAPGVVASQGAFESKILEDHVHVNANGSYLVDLVWFGALYQQSPVGRVYALGAHLTSPQAKLFQELAWDVVQNYPDCGLYQEGKEPCAKPEILKEGKQITLHSATPGVWYRYTLDGTTPTRTRGYVYCGVITDQPGIQVKAIAYKSGMADSAITEGALSP